jgi:CBS-domain-containing membrane protein
MRIPVGNSHVLARDFCSVRYSAVPSDLRFSAKLVPTFADRGWHVVIVTNPYGRILGFLDRSRYFLYQVAPQLYSRG